MINNIFYRDIQIIYIINKFNHNNTRIRVLQLIKNIMLLLVYFMLYLALQYIVLDIAIVITFY